jgi:hypothetical protein
VGVQIQFAASRQRVGDWPESIGGHWIEGQDRD